MHGLGDSKLGYTYQYHEFIWKFGSCCRPPFYITYSVEYETYIGMLDIKTMKKRNQRNQTSSRRIAKVQMGGYFIDKYTSYTKEKKKTLYFKKEVVILKLEQ